ncbi:MAG: putative IIA-like nitrogen-regulatory protein PtsN [Brevibacillus sp.]|nr:putative IIA-like nitrogen-regulatory protein PtsN [Brevibacillus sp.]
MSLSEYIGKDHIRIFEESVDQSELLNQLGGMLIQTGAVSVEYIKAVCEREKDFPTGLYTGEVNVAIPHADPGHHVMKPTIALGVVRKGVPFRNMADPTADIPVQLVFLLAPERGETQLVILEQIMNLIQDQANMRKIMDAQGTEDVWNVLGQLVHVEEKS